MTVSTLLLRSRTVRLLPLLLLCAPASAQLRMPSLFSDGMVLQRETQAPLWGHASAGAEVEIEASWSGGRALARANDEGRWRVKLPTPGAGGPHTLRVSSAGDVLTIGDVLVGEVWLASGQSNMEWTLNQTDGAEAEIAAADHPRLRFFKVSNTPSMLPAEDCSGAWRACRAGEVGSVTAVGYHFALDLLSELDVPVGIVNASWGGTPAKSWTSTGTLAARGDFSRELARVRRAIANPDADVSLAELRRRWWQGVEEKETGLLGGWMASGLKVDRDRDWGAVELPGLWANVGLGAFNGCVWYRRTFELSSAEARQSATLELGSIDDLDRVWINGEVVGETRDLGFWNTPRRYRVPADVLRSGANSIAILAIDLMGAGRVGSEGVPMQLTSAGHAPVELSGVWRMRVGSELTALGAYPSNHWFDQNYPTALFNAYLSPLIPYALRGAIWYQGEADVQRYETYRTLFPDMIRDWRASWGQDEMPFYFVQIAPFGYAEDTGQAARLREAQTAALELPRTGMAVTIDIGNPTDIHPRNKRDVGARLARLALARTYGRDVACEGPTFRSMEVEGSEVRIRFDHATGLTADAEVLESFTLAGADRVFHPARAVIDGETVVVSSASVPQPVAVRFGWGAADGSTLRNAEGLPAAQFRSDDWD